MGRLYSKFRVLLFTLAFGLASVWLWNGYQIRSDFTSVDLPTVQSDDVLYVFGFERRFEIYGGSGPHGPNVKLELVKQTPTVITFRLTNNLFEPIFVNHIQPQEGRHLGIVPSYVECQPSKYAKPITITQEPYHKLNLRKLEPQGGITFAIEKPQIYGLCIIAVPYERSESSAQGNFGFNQFNPKNWKDLEMQPFDYTGEHFVSK